MSSRVTKHRLVLKQKVKNSTIVAANGDRQGIRNIGMLISDGQSTDRDATKTEATAMNPEDITLIALGVDVKGKKHQRF